MKRFTIAISAACFFMAVSSCEKECKKNEAPVVTIVSPTDSSQLSDSVVIAVNTGDEVWLNDLAIMVHNTNGDTVFATKPDVYGTKWQGVSYTYYTTTAGNFQLQVVASDNEGLITEKEVSFTVTP